MSGPETTRRGFIELTGAAGVAALGGGVQTQVQVGEPDFDQYGVLIGPDAARPARNGPYLSQWDTFNFLYIASDAGVYAIQHTDAAWQGPFPLQPGYRLINKAADLPKPEGGVHTLDGTSAYFFTDFVASNAQLDPNGSPVLGYHGGVSGFIHTAGQAAITSTDTNHFMRNFYLHAPAGTIYDIEGDQSTEMLVESVSVSDAPGFGNVGSLGTVTGFRVPTWKGCNFEDFDGGLTFDGSPDKIAFFDSPFRGVSAANVDILTLSGSLSTDIVQIKGCYVKSVEPDTVVVNAEAGSLPSEVFQYIDTTHDASVTKSNILTGDVGVDTVGTKVSNSFPIADSTVGGMLGLATGGTVTGSGSSATRIGSANVTTSTTNLERMTSPADGQLEYEANFDETQDVYVQVGALGDTAVFSIYLAKNGSIISDSQALGLLSTSSDAETLSTAAKIDLSKGDTISAYLENNSTSTDLAAGSMTLTV